MMESTPALALEDVSKRFGRIPAVDHLSLSGRTRPHGWISRTDGAGKSTTLYMIPPTGAATSGRISIFGVDSLEGLQKSNPLRGH